MQSKIRVNYYQRLGLFIGIIALALGQLVLTPPAAASSTIDGSAVLLINQRSQSYPAASKQLGDQIEQLLRHSFSTIQRIDEGQYQAGQAREFTHVVVIGNDALTPLPATLLADLAPLDRPTLWVQYGLNHLPVDLDTAAGFTIGYNQPDTAIETVEYHQQSYPARPVDVREITVTDPATTILASFQGGGKTTPYIIRGHNLWYVNGVPQFSAGRLDPQTDSSGLIFADLLHEFANTKHVTTPQAIIHVADVTVNLDPTRLRNTAEYLYQQRVPYALSVTPTSLLPDGKIITLWDRPELVDALRYAQMHGATIVLHGEQAVTDNDEWFEYWDATTNQPLSNETRTKYTQSVEIGLHILRDLGLEPRLWETPKYTASPLAYEVFAKYFSYSLENQAGGVWSPYLLGPDQYGMSRIPVVTGSIKPSRGETVAVQLQRAAALKIVRDSWMVAYYNPASTPLAELQTLINGLQQQGYIISDLRALSLQTHATYQPNALANFRGVVGIGLPLRLAALNSWLVHHIPSWTLLRQIPWQPVVFVFLTGLFLIRLREQWQPPRVIATSSVEQPLHAGTKKATRRITIAGTVILVLGVTTVSTILYTRNSSASPTDSADRLHGWSDLNWTVKYDGYGQVGYSGDIATLSPQVVTDNAKTSAALALAGDPEWQNYSFSVRMQLVRQLRQNAPPNVWETGWLFFRYQADDRSYYLAHKTNGLELGKLVPAANGSQVFLATTATPVVEIGYWHDYRIEIVNATIRVYVDGVLQIEYTDPDPIPSGRVGLYTEDAQVMFQNPSVTPIIVQTTTPTLTIAPNEPAVISAELPEITAPINQVPRAARREERDRKGGK